MIWLNLDREMVQKWKIWRDVIAIVYFGAVITNFTFVTACRNAALPTFWRCFDITTSILLFSFSMCRRFSSSFNLMLFSCEAIMVLPPFSSAGMIIHHLYIVSSIYIYRNDHNVNNIPTECCSTCWDCWLLCCCHVVVFGKVANVVFFSPFPFPFAWPNFLPARLDLPSSRSCSVYVKLIPFSELCLLRFAKLANLDVSPSELTVSLECKICLSATLSRLELEVCLLNLGGSSLS